MDVSYERANELLSYDPLTGFLTWKTNRGSAKSGSLAGTIHGSGYLVIRIDRKLYQAHRICWLLFYGSFPKNELDHKNLIKADNRLENLRLATRSQNSFNKPKMVGKTSRHKGVCFNKRAKKWAATFKINGKQTHLGYFISEDAAAIAYNNMIEKFNVSTAIKNGVGYATA